MPPGLPHPSANGQQLPIKTNGNNHCKTEINLESSSASPSSSDSSSGSNNRSNIVSILFSFQEKFKIVISRLRFFDVPQEKFSC